MLDTLGKQFSWAQLLSREPVLHRVSKGHPAAGQDIFETDLAFLDFFKNIFKTGLSISLVLDVA